MEQLIRLRDFEFLLHDVLKVESLCESPLFAMHSREIFDSILTTAKRLAEDKFYDHASQVDQEPPSLVEGKVVMNPAIKLATDAFRDNGFGAAPFPEAWGGMGLPATIVHLNTLLFSAANVATATYPTLTMAAANMLLAHGDEALKERWLPDLVSGRFFGTMCLSEPHAGSSLTNLRTTAKPLGDGTYAIKGSKMWITGGDHELSENIVHFVLARLPDGGVGTRGISLFLVPKYRLNDDESIGEHNHVHLVGLNHKMGYRGSINGVLEFGETGTSVGYLVGIPHAGLSCMFHMMNEARIGTGIAAVGCAYAGLRHSAAYAAERPQGFKPGERDQSQPEVMIIEHADVRRMLLAQKAIIEGSAHLTLYCAMLTDQMHAAQHAGDSRAGELEQMLALLTPIAKAWVSEHCIDANRLAIQVLAGCGYTHDYPVERLYRDNRLNAIVEGTTGIQAIDLLGRKIAATRGASLQSVMGLIEETIGKASAEPELADLAASLGHTSQRVAETTMGLMGVAQSGDLERFLANATPYLNVLGHTVVAWLWLEQGLVIVDKLKDAPTDGFLLGRRQAMRYFFKWELPRVAQWLEVLHPVDHTCLEMSPDWF